MHKEYRSIYQRAREIAGMIQEKAANMLNISVESLRMYESGKRPVPNQIVADMVDIYGTRELGLQHLRMNPLGQRYIPALETKSLPMAVLCLVDDLKDCINHMDDLISIARDGVVNKDEVEIWEKAMKDLDELLLAIINIRLVKH